MPVTRISRFGLVNAYLVEEDDGLTLVDSDAPAQRQGDPAGGRPAAPIRRIALTHAHGDHIGSLDALAAELPGVEVLISARDARLLAKDKTLEPERAAGQAARRLPAAPGRARRATVAARASAIGSLEVVASPGHTPGHVAFFDTRDGTLDCGDAYSTLGGVATAAKVNPRFPLPGAASWHRPTALESAKALRALEPARLAPGTARSSTRPLARWTRRSPRRRLSAFGGLGPAVVGAEARRARADAR